MHHSDQNPSNHHAIGQEIRQRETANRWNSRLTAYAWVLLILASVLFMSEWGSEMHQWLEGISSLSSRP